MDLEYYGISKRALALRSGLCYTHVLKVLNGKVRPRLETMLLLDEALDQLIEDKEEDREHVCGLQGFGALGDTCPGCEERNATR